VNSVAKLREACDDNLESGQVEMRRRRRRMRTRTRTRTSKQRVKVAGVKRWQLEGPDELISRQDGLRW
jgi:hypothetical protein